MTISFSVRMELFHVSHRETNIVLDSYSRQPDFLKSRDNWEECLVDVVFYCEPVCRAVIMSISTHISEQHMKEKLKFRSRRLSLCIKSVW